MRITFSKVEANPMGHADYPSGTVTSDIRVGNTKFPAGTWIPLDDALLGQTAPLDRIGIHITGGGTALQFKLMPTNWNSGDNTYVTYYGTMEFDGAIPTSLSAQGAWYSPEREHDGTYSAPDDDETYIKNDVVYFFIHTKNVGNQMGGQDQFGIYLKASPTSSAKSGASSASSIDPCVDNKKQTGIFCCLPALKQCLRVSDNDVCTQAKGKVEGDTMVECTEACINGSSDSSSSSDSSGSSRSGSDSSSSVINCSTDMDCPQPPVGACSICKTQSDATCAMSCSDMTVACVSKKCVYTDHPSQIQCAAAQCHDLACTKDADCPKGGKTCPDFCDKNSKDAACTQHCTFVPPAQCYNNVCALFDPILQPQSCPSTLASKYCSNIEQCSSASAGNASVSSNSSPASSAANCIDPRIRVTYTKVESNNPNYIVEPRTYINGDKPKYVDGKLQTIASGEWVPMYKIATSEGDGQNAYNGVHLVSPGDLGITLRAANVGLKMDDYNTYATYYGTVEIEGATLDKAYCRKYPDYQWYCPELEWDNTYSVPDNDEVYVQNGVAHFFLHTRRTSGTGSTDMFSIHFIPTKPGCTAPGQEEAAGSAMSCASISSSNGSRGSSSSSKSGSVGSSTNSSNSNGSNSSNGSNKSGSNSSTKSSGSNGSNASNTTNSVGGACTGNECAEGGNSFCASRSQTCALTGTFPCLRCEGAASSTAVAAISSNPGTSSATVAGDSTSTAPFIGSSAGSLAPGAIAFLGDTCSVNAQCVTNLCKNNLCVPCMTGSDCSSNLCRNGACLETSLSVGEVCAEDSQCASNLCANDVCVSCSAASDCASGVCSSGACVATETLPSAVNRPPVTLIDPVTGRPLLAAPTEVLPATVIELPFTASVVMQPTGANNQSSSAGQNAGNNAHLPAAPSTPSTGPTALVVMLAGGAAGWLYRRRR